MEFGSFSIAIVGCCIELSEMHQKDVRINVVIFCLQLINEFVKKENIPFSGARPAVVLLGRDTRPSGDALLKAAKDV